MDFSGHRIETNKAVSRASACRDLETERVRSMSPRARLVPWNAGSYLRLRALPAPPGRCAAGRGETIGRFRLDVGLSPSSWAVVSDVVRVPFLPQVESPKPPYPKAQDYRSYKPKPLNHRKAPNSLGSEASLFKKPTKRFAGVEGARGSPDPLQAPGGLEAKNPRN